MEKEILKLLELSKRKLEFDKVHPWSKGSETYLQGLKDELKEVEEEINTGNNVYLEDELGDLLWDFFNLLVNLDAEGKINMENIPKRSHKKFTERIDGIENNISWYETKKQQKEEIRDEQELHNIKITCENSNEN